MCGANEASDFYDEQLIVDSELKGGGETGKFLISHLINNSLLNCLEEQLLQARDVQLMKNAMNKLTAEKRDWSILCPGDQQLKVRFLFCLDYI